MSLSKQAKVLNPKQVSALLNHVDGKRWSKRDRVIVMLSCFVGLRAKEIAGLTWASVTDGEGQIVDVVEVTNKVAKGRSGGRMVPLKKDVVEALGALRDELKDVMPGDPIVMSERGWKKPMVAGTIVNKFVGWFAELGMDGCSSHSGRRTFITGTAKKIASVGGSLRDIQQMAGHSSLAMTQRYIEGDSEAKKKVVELL